MYLEVHNWDVNVGDIDIKAVTASSIFLIGDTETIQLQSYFDTPPESYIVGEPQISVIPGVEGS